MTPHQQAHFRVLQILSEHPEINQRDLAQRLGVSIGKTNYLIKALIEKGWIKIGNFRRAESKLKKAAYLLTPAGIAERVRLIQSYLARKEAEYDALRAEIETLKGEMAGVRGVGKTTR
jgi:MarR family transcriptional regulator, temperature-dependent positive regulator of motility